MPDHYEGLSGEIASATSKQMVPLGGRIQAAHDDGYVDDEEHRALCREHHRRWVVLNEVRPMPGDGTIEIHGR